MRAGFSSGGCSIVTAETGTKDLAVIQGYDQIYPGRRRNHVASFTHIRGRRMIYRLARCNTAIVATEANTDHLRVIQG